MNSKKVEFLARFPKKKTLSEEDAAFITAQKIINPDKEESVEDLIEYEYDFIIVDLKDVSDIIRYDEEHTQVIKYSNMLYILKITYADFKELYVNTTGTVIFTST